MKTVILVNGVPASGKSTVARHLSNALMTPYLSIDGIKEPFMRCSSNIDRESNRALGRAAYEVIWSIVAQAPDHCVYVIDAWFGFQPKERLEQYLQQAGVSQVLEVWNQISGSLAVERYSQRLNTRLKGHPGAEYLPELKILADKAKPMGFGPIYQIDQNHATKNTNLDDAIAWLRNYLE